MKSVDPLIKQIGQLLDARLKTHETNIKAEIKATEQRLDKRLHKVEGRVGGVEARLDKVEGRLGGVETRLDKVEGGLGGVEKKLDEVASTIENVLPDHNKRIKTLEKQLISS